MRATRLRDFLSRRAPAGPDPTVLAFQNDLDSLVGERVPALLRYWPALGAALLLALIAAAGLAPIDIVVTAPGRLATEAPPVVLQPIDRAVLREVMVRPGERVREGQPVALLDATFTAADRDALEAQRRSLAAQRDRLEAERAGTLPAASLDRESLLQGEVQAQRGAVHAARIAAQDAELAALAAARDGERRGATGLAAQLALAVEVEAMRAKLLEGQVGSRIALLGARNARLEAEQALQRQSARLQELDLRIAARTAERDAFLRDWQRQVAEDLARIRPELARVEEQLAKAERLDALTLLRAPRDAIVLETIRRAPGSLVREGEAVVVLVPLDSKLVAEIALRSSEIGRLTGGDPARLKIDAFPWRRHGTLDGTLRSVSRESYPDQGGGGAMHRGQVAIAAATLARLPEGAALLPGMTLSAEIKVGTRSVLDFFLEPLLRGLDESLHEP